MYDLIQRKKEHLKNEKGFTLVEVIVVLVILAILAGIFIPSMIKYIDKAEEKAIVAEGRSVLLAMQTVATENYATVKVPEPTNYEGTYSDSTADGEFKDVCELAELAKGITISDVGFVVSAKVDEFTYQNGKYKVTYEDGAFTPEKV